MVGFDKLSRWLSNSVSESKDKRYRHRLLKEDLNRRCETLEELKSIVQKAHEDARRHLRSLAEDSPKAPGRVPRNDAGGQGEAPLVPLIREVLDKERDLIGDERDRILWYTGCAQLVK